MELALFAIKPTEPYVQLPSAAQSGVDAALINAQGVVGVNGRVRFNEARQVSSLASDITGIEQVIAPQKALY